MGTAEDILVIYLSVMLAVFLTLGIVLLAYGVKVAHQVSRMTDKAEGVVDKASDVVEQFQTGTALASIGHGLTHIFKTTFGKAKHQSKEEDEE